MVVVAAAAVEARHLEDQQRGDQHRQQRQARLAEDVEAERHKVLGRHRQTRDDDERSESDRQAVLVVAAQGHAHRPPDEAEREESELE